MGVHAWTGLLAFLLGFFSLSVMAGADEFGREGNLEIWIRTDKPIYDFGEPIRLVLSLRNRTTEPLAVNGRFGIAREIEVELFKEPEGFQEFLPPEKESPFRKEDFIVLKPGENLEKAVELRARLAAPATAGGYILRVFYRNKESGKALGLSAWTGEIISNRLNIRIRPAQKMSVP